MNPYPTFSQLGEDRIAQYMLTPEKLGRPIQYLDLGAAWPMNHNNTYLFYSQFGASGVLVDADPSYLAEYAAHRPRDVVVSAAVLPSSMGYASHVDFFRSVNTGWSTILPSQAHAIREAHPIEEKLSVPAKQVTAILEEHFPDQSPDLVSIDVEGIEHELLKDIGFTRWRPKVVIVENGGWMRIHDEYMISRGYDNFGYTFVNSIYGEHEFLKSLIF